MFAIGPLTLTGDAHDELADNYLAIIKLASIRPWLRAYESTP